MFKKINKFNLVFKLDNMSSNIFVQYTVIFIFLRYQLLLSGIAEWPDESNTIVTSKLMITGKKLYTEIANIHGPLIFLPAYLLNKIGEFSIQGYRSLVAGLQLIALTSVYKSPLLNPGRISQFYIVTISAIILIIFPKFYSQTYTYHSIGGLLVMIILSQYSFPSIYTPSNIKKPAAILCNFLIACLPFLAISYLPASIILFFVSLQKKYFNYALWGLIGGLFLNILFLYLTASFLGYYVNHIYINTQIMPTFDHIHWSMNPLDIIKSIGNSLTTNLAGFFSMFFLILIFFNIKLKQQLFKWKKIFNVRLILIIAALLTFLFRGSDLHALPYYYAFLTLPLLFLYKYKEISKNIKLLLYVILFIVLIKLLVILPKDQEKFENKKIPKNTEFSVLVQKYTLPNDRIIAYSYQPYEYIASHRLPASGEFSYFPQMQAYKEAPIFDIKIDGCADIKKEKPKLMLVDKKDAQRHYNSNFEWLSYASCIQDILDNDYIKISNSNYYLRRSLLEDLPK
jgi:hypothetical protein